MPLEVNVDRKLFLGSLILVVGASTALAGCGKAILCTPGATDGGGCYPISGGYNVVYSPTIHCGLWNVMPDPLSVMTVSETGSNTTFNLIPSAVADTTHQLNGTEDVNGFVSVQEAQTTSVLGVPYAQVNGSFTSLNSCGSQPPYLFTGTLQLIQTGAASADAGAGASGCGGTYNIKAQQVTDANGDSLLMESCFADGGLPNNVGNPLLPDGGMAAFPDGG
jgi:hypothetical protein